MGISSKSKVSRLSKLSNVQWLLLGIVAAGTCFGLMTLWMKFGFCIPCYAQAIWNGMDSWIRTGVFPFW